MNFLRLQVYIGVCTDGAGAMMGKHAAFVAKVKEHVTSESVTITHCMIHKEALAAKHISTLFFEMLSK